MTAVSAQIDVIVGLGNPGPDYSETRHNAGFWFLDRLAGMQGRSFSREPRFFGDICKVNIGEHPVRLLKPMGFMNRSGQSVAALARYFKIPNDSILIVHDDLDLAPGDARFKYAGGHGGHNGLRDSISHLGNAEFWRVRLGIGHPGNQRQVVDYVLQRPSREHHDLINEAITSVLDVAPMMVNGDMQKAMNSVHARRPKPTAE